MKKLKFKNMEEKKEDQKKKKNMEEPGLCSIFFLLTQLHGLYPNIKK